MTGCASSEGPDSCTATTCHWCTMASAIPIFSEAGSVKAVPHGGAKYYLPCHQVPVVEKALPWMLLMMLSLWRASISITSLMFSSQELWDFTARIDER